MIAAWALCLAAAWDSGGVDTLDTSAFTIGSVINLTPGSASSRCILASGSPTTYTGTDNVSMSYGTISENAIGGIGSDTLIDNDDANNLDGGQGSDTLIGGAGNDMFVFSLALTAAPY